MKSFLVYAQILFQLFLICSLRDSSAGKSKKTATPTATVEPILVTSTPRNFSSNRPDFVPVNKNKYQNYVVTRVSQSDDKILTLKPSTKSKSRRKSHKNPDKLLSPVNNTNFVSTSYPPVLAMSPSLTTAAQKNPCADIKCSKFEECYINMQRLPICKCPNVYMCSILPKEYVCSVDGNSFKNICLLKIKECQENRNIKVAHRGKCSWRERMKSRREVEQNKQRTSERKNRKHTKNNKNLEIDQWKINKNNKKLQSLGKKHNKKKHPKSQNRNKTNTFVNRNDSKVRKEKNHTTRRSN
ncbi:hypothetical protein HELRODRAFT_163239 [Helobdella robusta]|uniref:Kazal-like domain-containing protein n=1 Tax=Helobdella robusta TaxID=6412 RepID=T1ETT8_HELRO|nr:hypothetical protein HELRODRAFT_163239 [Helobdella robusta]ESN96198.1 hypothetical protein HELRODRAFT_163239 [Helobdella robusta]